MTGMQSAIARGWTSANSNNFRQLAQPERMQQPPKWQGYDLEWIPGVDLPWGVEVREDTDGRPYRVASAERTLLELAVNERLFGIDDVEECYRGAFDLSAVRPDMLLLRRKAKQRGEKAADQAYYYARNLL
ncbi:hypothetical protein [Sinorhizobium meliloti]|uniref:hypothetical protein n=1 Tax=Rhizobium meliloti TaxID=382 RepID=UPI000FE0ED54|nr:hypothetical protein [Sinorhizobium meliloti]RVL94726.1 hypothetical protein CN136_21665 [Sinorhizobium meliloti]